MTDWLDGADGADGAHPSDKFTCYWFCVGCGFRVVFRVLLVSEFVAAVDNSWILKRLRRFRIICCAIDTILKVEAGKACFEGCGMFDLFGLFGEGELKK